METNTIGTVRRQPPPLWGTAATAVNLTWELYEWSRSEQGRSFFANFADSRLFGGAIRHRLLDDGVGLDLGRKLMRHYSDPLDDQGTILRIAAAGPFGEAPLYLVTREMAAVAKHAARTMEDQPLLPTDLPSEAGVILLDGDYPYLQDRHGNTLGACGFSWSRGRILPDDVEGVFISVWSDSLDPNDDISRRYPAAGLPRLSMMHIAGWTFGHTVSNPLGEERAHEGQPENLRRAWEETTDLLRVFVSLIALMRQRIAVSQDAHLPRQARRDFARSRRRVPDMKVVTLRRAYAPAAERNPEPRQVDWQSRWMVSGHWRQQWYPSIGDHRQIWIAPYVKGPEGKPLVLPDEVYKLRR